MRPSIALALHRDAARATVARYPVLNPRVFGSVLHGTDREDSDLDVLVDPIRGRTSLFDLSGLMLDLERLLGVPVGLHTPKSLGRIGPAVLQEAQPL